MHEISSPLLIMSYYIAQTLHSLLLRTCDIVHFLKIMFGFRKVIENNDFFTFGCLMKNIKKN